jgi:hypothetical protein
MPQVRARLNRSALTWVTTTARVGVPQEQSSTLSTIADPRSLC